MFLMLKAVPTTFLLVCFINLKESTCGIRKNLLFHFESPFRSRDNEILNFQIFKCHDVLNANHETCNLESKQSLVMKFGQFM